VTIWRISNHLTLAGSGGLRASSRWHTRGRPILFCAPNPATALLEILVQARIDITDMPATHRYLEIEVPDSIGVQSADLAELGGTWTSDLAATRALGDRWLRAASSALLLVPCAIVPATLNVLVNPRHRDSAGIVIKRIHEQPIDLRLVRSTAEKQR
jgi:RES domain-containing protein